MSTLLLVEDNEMNRNMLSRRLERRGFEIIEAENGEEAIDIVNTQRPALVLMDLSLPVMDGWEATRRLKSTPISEDIPIIALTAHAMEQDRERSLNAGCDAYETKPVDLSRLLATIDQLLDGE